MDRPAAPRSLRFQDIFDVGEIQSIQDAFARATGVTSIILDPRGRPLTRATCPTRICHEVVAGSARGRELCRLSDEGFVEIDHGEPVIKRCAAAGLWTGGAAITVGDQHLATWLVGQVRDGDGDPAETAARARELGVAPEDLAAAVAEVPVMSERRFREVCDSLQGFARLVSRLALRNVQLDRHIADKQRAEAERQRLEEHLRQATKLEALGRLAGGVAHDFNNLLTGMIGYVELLQLELSDRPDASESLVSIHRAADRASDLVRHLLQFARKSARRSEPVDVNAVIDEVVRLLRRSIDPRVEIRKRLDPDVPPVLGDATQIENALLNLAVNARDAMPDGGRLVFETRTVDGNGRAAASPAAAGNLVQIRVRDTGCGMDTETRSHLFEPFFTTKPQGRGTGLGLSGVYGCVESHGGHIAVDSTPGGGTTFTIRLPAAAAAVADLEVEAGLPDGPRRAGRILLADDEESVRHLTTAVLQRVGYEVKACENGVEALAAFHGAASEWDLVVLDLMMPRLSGEQVFRALREEDPSVRVLFMSGCARHETTEPLLAAGAAGFVAKPFRPIEFVREVDRLLGDGVARAAGAAG